MLSNSSLGAARARSQFQRASAADRSCLETSDPRSQLPLEPLTVLPARRTSFDGDTAGVEGRHSDFAIPTKADIRL